MSSPNEPGHPRAGDAPGGTGNGSAQGPAHGAEHGDVPPWQRGPAARARAQQAPDAGGLDARLNRFISGGQDTEQTPRGERTEAVRTEVKRPDTNRPEQHRPDVKRTDVNRTDVHRPDTNRPEPPTRSEGQNAAPAAYASELPDLSGPQPRPAPPRKAADRPAPEQPAKSAQKASSGRAVQVGPRQHSGPVRASMQIRRVDPWSALKVSLVLSVALFFVWMIAVAFLYLVLGGMGVWSKLNSNVGDLLTSAGGGSGGELVSSGTIFGGAALIGLVNIVLMSAAATIAAFIYNLTTDLVGGIEVTLADRD